MDSGNQSVQDRLHGFLKKIKTEELRNKVAVWQKYLSNASSRFRFDSLSSVDDSSSSSSRQPFDVDVHYDNEEDQNVIPDDVCTPSDSGTCILIAEKSSEMEDPLPRRRSSAEVKLLTSPGDRVPRNKSPVQLWVDSLPTEESIPKIEDVPVTLEPTDAEVEGFTLGAEAVGVTSPRPYPHVQVTNTCGGSDAGSHCSSMESLLESRRPDPEEILFELGFGGSEEPDTVSRIPARFLQPSTLKGVVIEEFLKHEQLLGHTYTSGFSGYRGLSGPYHSRPSGIVGKIMERLREAEVGRINNRHHLMTPHHKMNLKESVLSPDNRKWLERQGVSPEPEGRRIILGEKSFIIAKDGGIVEGSYKKDNHLLREEEPEKAVASSPPLEVKTEEVTRKDMEREEMEEHEERQMDDSNSNDKASVSGSDDEDSLESRHSSKVPYHFNGQLEIEYKTIALLASQLKGSELPVDIVNEEEFYNLTTEERKRVERTLVESALCTYQRRLRDLDLRCHLKDILTSEVDRVSNSLGRQDQEWINIARQMSNLLRHQETLRQELKFTRSTYGT